MNLLKRTLLSFLLLGLCLVDLQGQIYNEDTTRIRVDVSEITCFIDSSGDLNLDDVRGMQFRDSQSLGMEVLSNLNPSRNVWFHFTLQILEHPGDSIGFQLPALSRSHVFAIQNDGTIHERKIGLEDYENYYTVNNNQRIFPLGFREGETIDFYVKTMHRSRLHFLSDEFYVYFDFIDSFDDRKMNWRPSRGGEGYLFLLFCGIMIFQLLYVLVQWYLVRKREYFYYGCYVFTVFLYYFLRFSALFSENPDWAIFTNTDLHLFNDYLLILPSIFYFRFVSSFADLKVRDFKLYKHFKYFEVVLWSCLFAQMGLNLFPNDFNKYAVIMLAVVIQLPFIVYAFFRLVKQKREVIKFLLVGSVCAFTGHLIANLKPWLFPDFLPSFAPPEITMIGILLEITVFNAGLLFKARETDRERADAQEAYIKELKSRQEIQNEYSLIRDKISSDLHDDVGSSLSSIGIYSYAAKQNLKTGDTEQTNKLLDNIKASAESTLNAMSDLVWATNPRNDSNEKLIERIRSFGFEILSARECLFVAEVDEGFMDLSFNQATRKNLLLLMKEGINNAAKYSGATVVKLKIEMMPDQTVSLVLSDNGSGMDLTSIKPGNGMRTLQMRADEIGGELNIESDHNGTRIILCF